MKENIKSVPPSQERVNEELVVNGNKIESGQVLRVYGVEYKITVRPRERVVFCENVNGRPGGVLSFEEFKDWVEGGKNTKIFTKKE